MSELLKKYESIDQSKLNEATIKILNRVKTITVDFTSDDEKNNKIAEQVLNEVMKKNPDSIKIVKRTPKAKVTPKKSNKVKNTKKAKQTTSSTAKSSNNIMSVAKEIQKDGESWKDAMERAKQVLKERKEQVVQKQKTELEKLFALVKTKKELQGFTKSDIQRDAVRDAKPRGARVVTKQGSTSNQYGTFSNKLGRKYWETRDRHADRLAPNYPKDMPLLADGGEIESGKIWNSLHKEEKLNFLTKNKSEIEKKIKLNQDIIFKSIKNDSWDSLNENIKDVFNEHIKNKKFYFENIGKKVTWEDYKGKKRKGVIDGIDFNGNYIIIEPDELYGGDTLSPDEVNIQDESKKKFWFFADGGMTNLTMQNVSFEKGGIFYKEGSNKYGLGNTEIFIQEENDMYCVYDNVYNDEDENWEIKKLADFDNMDEAKEFAIEHSKKEYANGGSLPFMTDPNFGNFQNTGMFEAGGSMADLTEQEFLKKYFGANVFTENPSQYFEIKKLSSSDDAKVSAFVKELKADGFTIKKRAYSDFTSIMGVKKKDSFELGGAFMMTDLAGHTGGSDGVGSPKPLSGVSGTYYTGLVGETGAMSSGELFMDGGAMAQNQQVINDASQSYVNYYLVEGAGQGIYKDGGSIPNNYEGRTPEDIWNSLSKPQRGHFLFDHISEIEAYKKIEKLPNSELVEAYKSEWSSLDEDIKNRFSNHVREGQYAYGGKTKGRPSMRELYIEQIASLTGTRTVGVDAFAKEHNLTDSELSNLMTGIGRGMISRSDFVTALVGEKGNVKQKEVVAFAKSDKAYKMADGGNVLPPSKTYGENIYKAMMKFNISESEARKRYGQYTISQWNELLSEKMADGGGIRSWEEFNKIVSEKEEIVKKLTPKQVAEMWNENSFGVKEGISKPISVEEAKKPNMKMYLRNLLIENELTEDEYSKYFAKGGFVATVEFNVGDIVWQKDEKRYATVMNNYGNPVNGDGGEIRLDTSGNTMIFTYDPKTYENTGYNLVKLGEKGDSGKFTPKVLDEIKERANRLIDSRKERDDTEMIDYYEGIYKRLLDGEFDSMTGAKSNASNKKGSTDYTYVPNKDVKELSVVVKGQLRELIGSDILDGVYVKNSAKSTSKVDADAVFAKILKDAKEAKTGKSKRFDASDLKKINLEMVKKLVDAGYTEQQIRNIILGYAFDNEILAENELEYDNGIFSYEESYVKQKIDDLVEAKKNKEFVAGIEYPNFDWQGIIKKYKISLKPKNIVIKRNFPSGSYNEYYYEVFVGENIALGHQLGYKEFDSNGKLTGDYIEKGKKVSDITKQNAWQKERSQKAGFNGGYWYIVSSKIETIDDVLKTLLSQEDGYCKELELYSDSFAKTLKENNVEFADGGLLSSNEIDKLDSGFTISQLDDILRKMFPYSFGVDVFKAGKNLFDYNLDDKIKDDKLKLYFYDKSSNRELNYEVHQGQENTYFDFMLFDEEMNTYIGTFGFKDRGDVDKSYITKFVSFLHDAYHYPFQVRHSVMANGGFMSDVYANGGFFDSNEGFMRADNNRSFRYPEKEVYIETIDEPIDLTSNVSSRSNKVVIMPLDENIDLNDDNRVRATMGYNPKDRNPENFGKINPRAFEFMNLPMTLSKTHKND